LPALVEYLTSSYLLTFASILIALLPGYALIKIGGWLEKRKSRGTDGELICEICSVAPAAGVISSRYGPVSHAACETCQREGAEPIFMACFHIHRAGGPEMARERYTDIRSFHDGRYIGLTEILATYPDFADEFEDASE